MKPGVCITAPAGHAPDGRLAAWAEAAGFAAPGLADVDPGGVAVHIHDFRGEWDARTASEARRRSPGRLLVAAGLPVDRLAEVAAAGWDDYLESPLEEHAAQARLALLCRRAGTRAAVRAAAGFGGAGARLFDSSAVAGSVTDEQGNFVAVNRAYCALYGRTAEDLIGQHFTVVVRPEHEADARRRYASFLTRGGPETSEGVVLRGDGQHLRVRWTLWLAGEFNGRRFVGTSVVDITAQREAEARLSKSERRFQSILETSPDLVSISDLEGRFTFANGAFQVMLGYRPEDLLGRPVTELIHPDDAGRVVAALEVLFAGALSDDVVFRAIHGDGHFVTLESSGRLLTDEEWTGPAIIAISRDVTARQRSEEALRESEERFRTVANAAPVLIWSTDAEGKSDFFNRTWLEHTGRALEQELGYGWAEGLAREDRRRFTTVFDAAWAEHKPYRVEYRLRRADASYGWVLDHGVPRFGPDGTFAGYIGSAIDITATRQAAEENRRLTAILKVSQEASPDGILVVGLDGQVLSHNQRYREMWGLPEAVLAGSPDERRAAPYRLVANAEEMRAIAADALSRPTSSLAGEILLIDGRVFEVHTAPLIGDDGEPFGRLWQFRDVSVRKAAEAAVRASEEKYRSLFERVPEGLYQSTPDGRLLTANPALARLFGFDSEEELLATPDVGELYIDPGARPQMLARIEEGGGIFTGELRLRRKDGSELIVIENSRWVLGDDGEVAYLEGTLTDITDRKRAEEALRKSEERFSRAFHASPAATSILTYKGGVFLDVNAAYEELSGYSRDELLGRSLPEFGMWQGPEGLPDLARELRRNGALPATERKLRRKDGELRDWIESFEMIEVDGERCVLTTSLDITERKQAEAERLDLERKLLETQKLESLGVLAGGIAHDFNNLLVAIMGNANLAMMELPQSSGARLYLEEIETASERAADLARQMLAYSGKGRFVVERVELSAMVQEMGNLLHVSLPKKVALYYNLTAGLPAVEADPTQLRQVIMNLVINGAESIGDNAGQLTVSTGVLHANRAALAGAYLSPDLDEGDYVYVDVSDTGSGMDAATKARIFEPFFTTKFTGRGLGLAAVLGIVRRHGGTIKVESEPGQGTTFRLLLPAAPPEAAGPSKEAPAAASAGRTGAVLIADDEPTVRTVTARMLERMGFRVIAASDGQEALDLLAAHREEVTLVLLDMTMPRLDGREAVHALRELAPGVPVVLMSGYSEQESAAQFAEGGLAGFIQKPFTFDELKALVAAALPA